MMQNDSQRRVFLLLQLLLEQTDEVHSVSSTDILRFWAFHGIQANRKNVYSDIQLLMDFGLDIICVRSIQNRYFIGSRLLELPELKLLVDANHFRATVDVAPTPPFFSWVFTFGGAIRIEGPGEVLEKMKNMAAWLNE